MGLVTRGVLSACIAWVCAGCGSEDAAVAATDEDGRVERLAVHIERIYPHASDAFTQGLVYRAPWLYESTGLEGQSTLRRVELETGRVDERVALDPELFGEGLALVDDRLIQLSWQSGRALVWSLDAMAIEGEFSYAGEGWGLCHDGRHLVMSDGTSVLQIRDPETFDLLDTLDVHLEGEPVDMLNELECVDGDIFANVWLETTIVRIDGDTGAVTGVIDASELSSHPEITSAESVDVLNGIAHLPETDRMLLTGKLWPRMFEVELVPAAVLSESR